MVTTPLVQGGGDTGTTSPRGTIKVAPMAAAPQAAQDNAAMSGFPSDGVLPEAIKRGSVLPSGARAARLRLAPEPGREGEVGAFALPDDAAPLVLEAVTGRALTIVPGDRFLGVAGYRESTRWVVGDIPAGGLQPGALYWVLAASGVVGALVGDLPRETGHLGQVRYLGAVRDAAGGDQPR